MFPHRSILVKEWLQALQGLSIRYFIDATLGAGGHSEALLQSHPEIVGLLGIDQDPHARKIAQERLNAWSDKVVIAAGNFAQMDSYLPLLKQKSVDGILLDLGVSSMQLDQPERGFSFMRDGPLDMRMDPSQPLTAEVIVNDWPEEQLARVIRDFGEEKQWRQAARLIGAARKKERIVSTRQLVDVLQPLFYAGQKKGINPMTLIFQGLRICVNRELEVLEAILPKAIELLAPGGVLAIISFHSLEDRLVKEAFRWAASDKMDTSGLSGLFLDKEPVVKLLSRKPLTASDEEVEANPRSRSAKLRMVQKL